MSGLRLYYMIGQSAIVSLIVTTFIAQLARIEGTSMAPTLADQDRVIVSKLSYQLSRPGRGDIVMFYYPVNPDKTFVARVIAEEGDEVRIADGQVYVNDILAKDEYVPTEYRSHDDFGPEHIKEGYYFVMGDHRNNSSDSRHWGLVPRKYIVGRIVARLWPTLGDPK